MNKSSTKETFRLRIWPIFLLFFLTNTFFLLFFTFTLSPARREAVSVHIPSGTTLHEISKLLAKNRVIKNRTSFELLCKLRGLEKDLHAGDYVFAPGVTPWEVISLLTTGQGELVRLTIPEGLTNKEVFEKISSVIPGLDREKLTRLADGKALAADYGIDAPGLMGYLFPDTYFVPSTIDEEGILRIMVERFLEVYDELISRGPSRNGFSRHENVILASIIEKEAVKNSERPIISSVFFNRLALNRPLESCATVLFVLGKHKSRLLYRDLEVDSPYNTYLHRGLPPGPICNPGKASLAAALYPAKTNYLYFVARGDGTHVFSTSLEDHNRAKRRYRRFGPGS